MDGDIILEMNENNDEKDTELKINTDTITPNGEIELNNISNNNNKLNDIKMKILNIHPEFNETILNDVINEFETKFGDEYNTKIIIQMYNEKMSNNDNNDNNNELLMDSDNDSDNDVIAAMETEGNITTNNTSSIGNNIPNNRVQSTSRTTITSNHENDRFNKDIKKIEQQKRDIEQQQMQLELQKMEDNQRAKEKKDKQKRKDKEKERLRKEKQKIAKEQKKLENMKKKQENKRKKQERLQKRRKTGLKLCNPFVFIVLILIIISSAILVYGIYKGINGIPSELDGIFIFEFDERYYYIGGSSGLGLAIILCFVWYMMRGCLYKNGCCWCCINCGCMCC